MLDVACAVHWCRIIVLEHPVEPRLALFLSFLWTHDFHTPVRKVRADDRNQPPESRARHVTVESPVTKEEGTNLDEFKSVQPYRREVPA